MRAPNHKRTLRIITHAVCAYNSLNIYREIIGAYYGVNYTDGLTNAHVCTGRLI